MDDTAIVCKTPAEIILACFIAKQARLHMEDGVFVDIYNDVIEDGCAGFTVQTAALYFKDLKPVASALIWRVPHCADNEWIVSVFTLSDHRRQGIGSELVRKLCKASEGNFTYSLGGLGSGAFFRSFEMFQTKIPFAV